jgi:predicted nucleic-acid-binding protein
MIGIDTNVLMRFLVNDDDRQNAIARRFLSERTADDPAYISAVTLAETVWLLRKRLNFPAADIRDTVKALLETEGLVIEHTEELDALLNDNRSPKADIADYLVFWCGVRAGCRSTVTFDRTAAKDIPGMELLT